jgi:hypothetical protein
LSLRINSAKNLVVPLRAGSAKQYHQIAASIALPDRTDDLTLVNYAGRPRNDSFIFSFTQFVAAKVKMAMPAVFITAFPDHPAMTVETCA